MEDNSIVNMIIEDMFNAIGMEDEEKKEVAPKQEDSNQNSENPQEGNSSKSNVYSIHTKGMDEDHMTEEFTVEDIWKNMESILEDNMDIWNNTSDILSRTEALLAEVFAK